jgi:hypothetical protein
MSLVDQTRKSAVEIVRSGLPRRIQLVSATLSNLTNLRDQEVCHGDVADSVPQHGKLTYRQVDRTLRRERRRTHGMSDEVMLRLSSKKP